MNKFWHGNETVVHAKLVILPEHLKYDDYDLTNSDEVFDLIKSKSVRPYIIVYREHHSPIFVEPGYIDIPADTLKRIVDNNYHCVVAIQDMPNVKFDHNGECLACDCWPSDCECFTARIEEGKALIYNRY